MILWKLFFNCLVLFGVSAFSPSFFVKSFSHVRRRPKRTSQLKATEKLIFKGDYETNTKPLPEGTNEKDIAKFLSQLPNRNIFLSAGGTRNIQDMPMTPQFKGFWQDMCAHFGSDSLPTDNDKLIAVATEIKFPGLRLVNTSVSGIKELYQKGNHSQVLQGLEVLLVAEKSEPFGAPPVVWLFNKLTGNSEREKDDFCQPKQTKARSIIGSKDLGNGTLALNFKLDMQVTIEFPAVLIKILPSSKEKMEEQGTSSILKTISKDINLAVDVAYNKFVEERLASMKSNH